MRLSDAPTKKYQSPEYITKIGIHSDDPAERSRAYAAGEDRTGTLGIKTKGKVKKYDPLTGKKVK